MRSAGESAIIPHMKKTAILGMALFAAFMAARGAYDIGADFADREKWTVDPVEFNIDHKAAGFRFVDQKRDCSVAMGEGHVEYRGVPVVIDILHGLRQRKGIVRSIDPAIPSVVFIDAQILPDDDQAVSHFRGYMIVYQIA